MNEEYIDNVKHLIEQKDADKVKGLLIDLHPADIAELCNDLSPEEARFVYRLLDNETAADVLMEMDEDVRKEFLEILPSETIALMIIYQRSAGTPPAKYHSLVSLLFSLISFKACSTRLVRSMNCCTDSCSGRLLNKTSSVSGQSLPSMGFIEFLRVLRR